MAPNHPQAPAVVIVARYGRNRNTSCLGRYAVLVLTLLASQTWHAPGRRRPVLAFVHSSALRPSTDLRRYVAKAAASSSLWCNMD